MSSNVKIPLSDAAEHRLCLAFAPEDRPEARRMLELECGAGIDAWGDTPAAYDRVRFGAMKASLGRLEGLRRAIAMAKADWRDLLVEAGFAADPTEHERWLVPGSTDAVNALRRWEQGDPLAGSAVSLVAGLVFSPPQPHVSGQTFTVHGVPPHEFVHTLLSALRPGEEVMLPDPKPGDDCGLCVRAVPGGWETRRICHGRFRDPWLPANRTQAFAWLRLAAEAMVRNSRIEGYFTPRAPRIETGDETG